jgi:hypothetical protein
VETHYYPGVIGIFIQANEWKSNGENFWHEEYDPADGGLYKLEMLRNFVLALLSTVAIAYYFSLRLQNSSVKKKLK